MAVKRTRRVAPKAEVMEEMVYKYLLDKNEVTMLEVLKSCFGFTDKDIANADIYEWDITDGKIANLKSLLK